MSNVNVPESVESPPAKRRYRWVIWSLLTVAVVPGALRGIRALNDACLRWLEEAHELAECGEYESSLECINRAIRWSPRQDIRFGTYGRRAHVYWMMGDIPNALVDARRAVEWSLHRNPPDYVRDLTALCRYEALAGEYSAALRDIDQLQRTMEVMPEPWHSRCTVLLAQGRYYRGFVYLKSGRPEAAEEEFAAAVVLDPELAERPYAEMDEIQRASITD